MNLRAVNMNIRGPQKATSSPRATGSPRGTNSPRAEVGEIDTRAPFQSVKAAVSLFGEVAVSKDKPIAKRSRASAEKIVLDHETQLLLAQNELIKLKEQLKHAETTKARALSDLEKAKKTLQELTDKFKSVTEAKQSAIQASEAVKNQLEAKKPMDSCDKGWKEDLDRTKEQYTATITELDAAKQELTKIRQDFDRALDTKMVAFEEAADAQYATKFNTERLGEIAKEIAAMRESLTQVKLASEQAQQDQARILAEKDVSLQSHKTAMEEVEKKLLDLKDESDPEVTGNLEELLTETTTEVEALHEELKKAHAFDMDAIKKVTLELQEATKTLQQVSEEESSLRTMMDSLKLELNNVKKEYTELSDREAAFTGDLNVKLQETKTELEAALPEETKARDEYDEMISKIKNLSSETETAKREAEEMTKNAEEEKQEAQTARNVVEEAEKKLPIAQREAEDAKAAEKMALDEIKILSERSLAARASSGAKINLSKEEYESISRKVEESDNLAEMKLAAAKAQVEAINASKNEADKRLETSLKELEEIKAATEEALKKAEMAHAAKMAVEGELRRWRQQEEKKAVADTEVSS